MELNGQRVFPLSKIDATWGKYFMNADGDVISTAMHKSGVKMMGTQNGYARYVTLAGVATNLQRLRSRVKLHRDWVTDTSDPLPTVRRALADALKNKTPAVQTPVVAAASWPFQGDKLPKGNPVAAAVQAPVAPVAARKQVIITAVHSDLASAIKGRGFIIARVNGNVLDPSVGKAIVLESDADAELERQARANPGVQFVKLQIKSAVMAGALLQY
jgi:hypothetical protein